MLDQHVPNEPCLVFRHAGCQRRAKVIRTPPLGARVRLSSADPLEHWLPVAWDFIDPAPKDDAFSSQSLLHRVERPTIRQKHDQLIVACNVHMVRGAVRDARPIQLPRDRTRGKRSTPQHSRQFPQLNQTKKGMQFRHPTAIPKVVMETSIAYPSFPLIPIRT